MWEPEVEACNHAISRHRVDFAFQWKEKHIAAISRRF